MKKLIYLLLLVPVLSFSQNIKYSVIIGDDYIQVDPDGNLDTITSNNIQAKVYEAILTVESALDPSIRVLRNDFGADVAWAHTATGTWVGTLADAFAANKTVVTAQQQDRGSSPRYYVAGFTDARNITLYAMNSSLALADTGVPQQVYVLIKRYQ